MARFNQAKTLCKFSLLQSHLIPVCASFRSTTRRLPPTQLPTWLPFAYQQSKCQSSYNLTALDITRLDWMLTLRLV